MAAKKFSKDEIQKIVLGGVLFCFLIYAYFQFLLIPLDKEKEDLLAKSVTLGEQVKKADLEILKTRNLESRATEADAMVSVIRASVPDGPPIAWYPIRMRSFFKRQGFDQATLKMDGEGPAPLPFKNFLALNWTVNLDQVEYIPLALMVSAFENEYPFAQIQSMTIVATNEDPATQRVEFNYTELVPSKP